eukprot:1195280-Prorocentrum_minimum.AAC.2
MKPLLSHALPLENSNFPPNSSLTPLRHLWASAGGELDPRGADCRGGGGGRGGLHPAARGVPRHRPAGHTASDAGTTVELTTKPIKPLSSRVITQQLKNQKVNSPANSLIPYGRHICPCRALLQN